MKKRRVLALLMACLFVLGCLGGPVFAGKDSAPGQAKKALTVSDVDNGDDESVTEQVYHPVHAVHPSLKGLQRAYQNMLRNQAGEQARAAIGQLIEARGGSVTDTVYGLENVIYGHWKKLDAETQGLILDYINEVLGEIEDEVQDPKDQAKLVRTLARYMMWVGEGKHAENHLRKALRLYPGELAGYEELSRLLQEEGDKALKVFLKGVELEFDVPPVVSEGRTLMPFRKLAEVTGGTVIWNPEAQTITFEGDDVTVVLTIGSKIALVNGEEVELDVAPAITDGRTLVPLRFVAEALGIDVDYVPNIVIIRDMLDD
ncbi:MAG: hypothetical protein IBX71_00995 [Candidatus Desulforudis sp.]|nr:hypothetical protein [Desulforudis sp.]